MREVRKSRSPEVNVVPWGEYSISPELDDVKIHPTDRWFKGVMEHAFPEKTSRGDVRILVIPSRWGEGVRLLQEADFDASGGDISEVGCAWGGRQGTRNLHRADITDMKTLFPDESFDVAYCANLYDVGADPRAVSELARVTRAGGLIYFIGSSRIDSSLFEHYGLSVEEELAVGGLKNKGSFRLRKTRSK
jgi:SAM-dependent methyltransferase